MSAESRAGFCTSGFVVAVLRSWRPEVREELVREVRNGRMSSEKFWRREEGIRSREQGTDEDDCSWSHVHPQSCC